MPDGKEKECGQHGRQIGMAERRAHTSMTTILRHTLLWIWRHARPFFGGLLLDIVVGIVGNGIYDSLKTEPTLYQDPSKLALVHFLLVSRWITLGIFLLLLALLLAAFLVHRADERRLALEHQRQQQALALRDQQQQEALSLTTQAVRVLLERQTETAVIAPPPADSAGVQHAPPRIWTIPYPHNPFFLGRDELLEQLHTHLHTGQPAALSQSPSAISGLGGIGKTQLAVEYAHRYRQEYEVVLWARAESEETLTTSYTSIATLLGLPEREEKETAIIVQAVITWLCTHQQWLLILDNADDLDVLPPFLPTSYAGHLLLTTRAWDMQRLATRFEVDVLSDAHGAELLLRRAGRLTAEITWEHLSQEDRHTATRLTQELGGLPLALDQAGAYMEATRISVHEYYALYQQHRLRLFDKRRSRIPDHPEGVVTTWSLSFGRIQDKNPAATDLLRLCAFLAPDAIPEELLTTDPSVLGPRLAPIMSDAFLCNEAMEALCAYSLIRRDPTDKTLSIHRLVQAVLQESLSKEEHQLWAERVVNAIHAAFPWPEHATWTQCERLLVQTRGAAALINAYHITTGQATWLLNAAASYLQDRAQYGEAEPLLQRVLRIRETSLAPDHPHVASALNNLANLYYQQSKHTQAEPLFLRALRIWEQSLGPDHPDVTYALHSLAELYRAQGKHTQAEPLFQRALRIREQSLGPDHPHVASTLNNLAILYREQGKHTQAEPLFLRALRIREQSLGPNHSDLAHPLHNLADLYQEQGKYEQAEPLYLRALRIREQSLGPDHPQAGSTLNNLAILYADQGKYTDAELLFLRALRITEQSLGPDHPQVASTLNGLALLYKELGKYEEAKPLFLRALTIRESSLGKDHHLTRLVREHYDTFQRTTHPKRIRSTLGALLRKRL